MEQHFCDEAVKRMGGINSRKTWVLYHVVDYPDCFSYRTCLESHVVHATYQIVNGNWSSGELVEIQLFDFLRTFWHFVGRD